MENTSHIKFSYILFPLKILIGVWHVEWPVLLLVQLYFLGQHDWQVICSGTHSRYVRVCWGITLLHYWKLWLKALSAAVTYRGQGPNQRDCKGFLNWSQGTDAVFLHWIFCKNHMKIHVVCVDIHAGCV